MMCEGSHHSSFCQCRLIGFRSLAWNYLPRRKRVTHRGMITFRCERHLIGDSITTCLKVQKTAYRLPNGFKQCRNGSLISQNGNQILAPKRWRIVRFEGGKYPCGYKRKLRSRTTKVQALVYDIIVGPRQRSCVNRDGPELSFPVPFFPRP